MNPESKPNSKERLLEGSLGHLLTEGGGREDVVVQALQECQKAIDAGLPIDRSAMLAKYPAIRDELSACLDGLALMQLSKADGNETPLTADSPASIVPSATLGDFQIQREIGRGGMGVVYEAEQLSVGRKVALKVLPYAAMLDKRQIARFQNEARAAATLEHPHIVPVYFVGNERGVYYYAMRLIDGRNLAEVMGELRGNEGDDQPRSENVPQLTNQSSVRVESQVNEKVKAETVQDHAHNASTSFTSGDETDRRVYFESVARLGVQIAEALEYAHSRGIIHRDVKPANIMLDSLGDAWITDFGLARIEADAGMTMSGALVGTLRYMAPEQIQASRASLDQRCDIYSLGATLYELLTLRPLFSGEDRETLLRQIAAIEPILPSRIDSGIPRDLETIVIKAINKSPVDRYETGQDLADDLNRFLGHQPILARRTSVMRRVRMWTRRHPTLFAAATLLCAISLFSAALLGIVIARYEHAGRVQQEAATAKVKLALHDRSTALERVKSQQQRADAAANDANELRMLAESRADRLRLQLYVREMQQAFHAWNSGWTDQVEELLAKQVPVDSQHDLRGFEWHLLNSLTSRPPSIELRGHEGSVHDLAVFANGSRIASVGEDASVRIWNLASNQEEAVLRDTRNVSRLLETLRRTMSGSVSHETSLASRGKPILRALAVSPDGTKLATGSLVLSLWDIENKKPIRDLTVFPTRIFGVAFSPNGELVAAHSSDEGMKVASTDGRLVSSAHTGAGSYRLCFSPDGSRLAAPFRNRSNDTKGIRCWNTQDWDDSVDYATNHSVRGCTYSNDGEFLFCGGYEGDAFILSLDSGSIQLRIPEQRSRPNDIAVARDDQSFAVAYEDGTVAFIELPRQWQQLTTSKTLVPKLMSVHEGPVNAVRFVDDNGIATCGDDGVIRISALSENIVEQSIEAEHLYNRFKFRPGTDELVAATTHGIRRYATNSWQVLDKVDLWNAHGPDSKERRLSSICFDAGGNIVGVGNRAGEIVLYDLEQKRVVHRMVQDDLRVSAIGDLSHSPDGKWLATGSRDHTVRVRSTRNWNEVYRVSTPGWGSNVEFSLDGRRLAFADTEGNITLIDASNWQTIAHRKALSGLQSDTLRFTRDNQRLITGHKDSVIRVWDADQLTPLGELKGHMKSVLGLNVHCDGSILASVSSDRTVRLWSLSTLAQLGTLTTLDKPTWSCEFSRDGQQLVVTESQHARARLHIWNTSERNSSGD